MFSIYFEYGKIQSARLYKRETRRVVFAKRGLEHFESERVIMSPIGAVDAKNLATKVAGNWISEVLSSVEIFDRSVTVRDK